jgi:hypothetical protein
MTTLAILAAALMQDATGNDRFVGGYYYPWYYKERWTNEPVAGTPRLGFYSSDDRAVAAQHVKWAKEAGLDFFLVSSLGAEGREGKNFANVVLPEIQRADFKFAVLYETPLALGLPAGKPIDLQAKNSDGTTAGDLFVKHFDHLTDEYFKHGSCLRRNNKAVAVVYLVRDMVNADTALRTVRQQAAMKGVDLFLVADVVYWTDPETLDWAFLRRHFQAVTAYNMHFRQKFLEATAAQFAAANRAAKKHSLRLIPNAMPGYDDTPLRGEGRPTLHRRRGEFYRDSWKVAAKFVDREQPLLFVTSFNEWHEGTELEPSEEYGDRYLKLTKELSDELRRRP